MNILKTNNIRKVYDYVSKIPLGKVTTYGGISKALGIKSARLVGQILHKNTEPKIVPCHRVVFSDGSLAKKYAFGGEKAQKAILLKEGVRFTDGKVDLERCHYSL